MRELIPVIVCVQEQSASDTHALLQALQGLAISGRQQQQRVLCTPLLGLPQPGADAAELAATMWDSMLTAFLRDSPDTLYAALDQVSSMQCFTPLCRLLLLMKGLATALPVSETVWGGRLPKDLLSSTPPVLRDGAQQLLNEAGHAFGSRQQELHRFGELAELQRCQDTTQVLWFIGRHVLASSSGSSSGGSQEVSVADWVVAELDAGVKPLWEQLQQLVSKRPGFSRFAEQFPCSAVSDSVPQQLLEQAHTAYLHRAALAAGGVTLHDIPPV